MTFFLNKGYKNLDQREKCFLVSQICFTGLILLNLTTNGEISQYLRLMFEKGLNKSQCFMKMAIKRRKMGKDLIA